MNIFHFLFFKMPALFSGINKQLKEEYAMNIFHFLFFKMPALFSGISKILLISHPLNSPTADKWAAN